MQPNLTDSSFYAGDPYPTYRWLRQHAPVYWDAASRLWVLSRYDDIVQVSKASDTFSVSEGVLPDSDTIVSIICMDEPRHTRLRKLVNRGFTPRMVGMLEPRIRALTAEILVAVAPHVTCDLCLLYTSPSPRD